jgi:hypothetical protein
VALWDVADCLARAKRLVNRPVPDAALADTDWYAFFTEAQSRVYSMLAVHCPEAVYGAPVLMTTADSGLTYTYGTDSGLPTGYTTIFPIGHVEIRASRAGNLLRPGSDWDMSGDVFVPEGDRIRFPGGRTRIFTDGPYARFVKPPGVVDATTGVLTLEPPFARILIVDDAVTRAAQRMSQDTAEHEARFQQDWAEVLFALKSQYHGQGLQGVGGSGAPWWRGSMGFTR